jgi:hypothetical protein
MLLDDTQCSRRVADVADVHRIPRGLQNDGLRLAISGKSGAAKRGGDGGDEVAARGHGWASFLSPLQDLFGHKQACFSNFCL